MAWTARLVVYPCMMLDLLPASAGYRVADGGPPGATIVSALRVHLEAGRRLRSGLVLLATGVQ